MSNSKRGKKSERNYLKANHIDMREENFKLPIMVKAQVEMMSQHLVHHFDGFEEIIKTMVGEQLTAEKLYEQIANEIGKTLRMRIGIAIDGMITNAVSNNKLLQAKIEARVNQVVRNSLKKLK